MKNVECRMKNEESLLDNEKFTIHNSQLGSRNHLRLPSLGEGVGMGLNINRSFRTRKR